MKSTKPFPKTSKMRSQSTTDLDIIRKDPRRFTWGRVIKIEDLGPYTFVHYVNMDSGLEEKLIHLYVDGKNTNCSSKTLDAALLTCLAFHNCDSIMEGAWAAKMAARVLNVKVS